MSTDTNDVPSPIDFHDLVQARAWEADTIRRRPWRPRFFAAFAHALNEAFGAAPDILELGSGPGHLAEHVLQHCNVRRYTALDFSEAMHGLARERLAANAHKVVFITRDFRHADCLRGLGAFDAVLTMQAAHETRHKNHLPPFLDRLYAVLRSRGLILYCDHYAEKNGDKNGALYVERDEQPLALTAAGFTDVQRLHEEGGMALYRGTKP